MGRLHVYSSYINLYPDKSILYDTNISTVISSHSTPHQTITYLHHRHNPSSNMLHRLKRITVPSLKRNKDKKRIDAEQEKRSKEIFTFEITRRVVQSTLKTDATRVWCVPESINGRQFASDVQYTLGDFWIVEYDDVTRKIVVDRNAINVEEYEDEGHLANLINAAEKKATEEEQMKEDQFILDRVVRQLYYPQENDIK